MHVVYNLLKYPPIINAITKYLKSFNIHFYGTLQWKIKKYNQTFFSKIRKFFNDGIHNVNMTIVF